MSLRVPQEELSGLRSRNLNELAAQIDWSDSAAGFLTERATFETVLQSVINHDLWFDALSLLAHALAPRQSIWWAYSVCCQWYEVGHATKDDTATSLLDLTRTWVIEPDDETRLKLHDLALAIPNRSPAHWIGMSVFWSTGNITPDAGVVTAPPPYLYARGVSACIDLAASLAGLSRQEVYLGALAAGIDLAGGGEGRVTFQGKAQI
ncbi:MAG: hypothetical protein AAGC91_02715 [Pseudomonadota bacterium]